MIKRVTISDKTFEPLFNVAELIANEILRNMKSNLIIKNLIGHVK